jgi:hypothetical protein
VVLDAITATGGPGAFMLCPGDEDPPQAVDAAIAAEFGPDFAWYPVVGNHEAETPADMTWIRSAFATLPWIVNSGPAGCVETTYSFEYGNMRLIVLNEYYNGVSDIGTDGDVVPALRAWLEADLRASRQPWIFVTGHEPAYPQPDMHWGDSRHVGDSLDQYPANRNAFWTLLDTFDVPLYITAHTHRYSRFESADVWQVDTAQARGAEQYDTFERMLVGADRVAVHVYRSLDTGVFRLVDVLTVDRHYADCDRDGDVDGNELLALATCLNGPTGALELGCRCLDLDLDADVDLADVAALQLACTGALP